jgi:2,3-bisphosphoglycerate-dependent phosphoglycerate mutase
MHKLVLLRHGQSEWNRENRFTGWTDMDLSPVGIEEARAPACCRRCSLSTCPPPAEPSALGDRRRDGPDASRPPPWRFNERQGTLQGLNKTETAALRRGAGQNLAPEPPYPPLPQTSDPRFPAATAVTQTQRSGFARTECLKTRSTAFPPYWHEQLTWPS